MSGVKVAVVTGSNKGIGLAIVRRLCKDFEGVVYLTARSRENGLAAVAKLEAEGIRGIDGSNIYCFFQHVLYKVLLSVYRREP